MFFSPSWAALPTEHGQFEQPLAGQTQADQNRTKPGTVGGFFLPVKCVLDCVLSDPRIFMLRRW